MKSVTCRFIIGTDEAPEMDLRGEDDMAPLIMNGEGADELKGVKTASEMTAELRLFIAGRTASCCK